MKKIILILSSMLLAVFAATAQSQGTGIGTISPDASAQLDVSSTNKGLLPPRMSQAQRNAISSPAPGLVIYNTSTNNLEVNTGTAASPIWTATTSSIPGTDSLTNGSPSGFTGRAGVLYTDTASGSPTIGNQWVWDGSSFVSYTQANATAFYNQGGVNDAGSNKNTTIYRSGPIGVGTNKTPDASAIMDLNSTAKGFLPPRMTRAQMQAISNPADGLMIFCTDCTPRGTYQYDSTTGTQTPGWVSIGSSSLPDATFTSATLNCGGALSGTYQQGTPTTGSNTKVVTITANTGGKYSATTNTVNGVTFSGSGTLLSTGANTQITLKATGTPANGGSFTYTVTLAGQTCTFSVTYAAPATYNCSGTVASTLSPYTDVLTNGQAYTGSVTVPYTAGNGSSYGTTTLTQNGLTLTRVAGTYASGGGNIVYNLSGTYTGTTGPNAVIFTLPEGCTVQFNGLKYSTLAGLGTDVYFEGLKVRIPPSGNQSLQVATTSGTMSAVYSTFGRYGSADGLTAQSITLGSSYTYMRSSYYFQEHGDEQLVYLRNTANNRVYKITMIIGASYLNNLIRIERFDTTAASNGVAGVVNSGVPLTLDNIRVQFDGSSSSKQLQVSTVSGTSSLAMGAYYRASSGVGTSMGAATATVGTSWVTPVSGWNFANLQETEVLYIFDQTAQKVYRVDVAIGAGYANNAIRLERMDVNIASYRQAQLAVRGTSVTVNNLVARAAASGLHQTQLSTTSGSMPVIGGAFEFYGGNGYAASVNASKTLSTSASSWAASSSSSNLTGTGQEGEGFIRDNNTNTWYRVLLVTNYNGGSAGVKSLIYLERY